MIQEKKRSKLPISLFLVVIGAGCIVLGLGGYTFLYAKGYSYLSDDPNGCVNCHVMREQYDAWQHSSHKSVAVCNDCHVPHGSFFEKWLVKGLNGFNHSFAFTFNTYPENITIKGFNADVVQNNCLSCHETAISMIAPMHDNAPNCLTCHAGIGHNTRD
ncbi:MAG: cytochrome c nitrite reductase small subunit [Phototrophicales bacterium]|nr:MAG: cytochrome c nitrite reductase small subunit [Phototrophicales bacterium]